MPILSTCTGCGKALSVPDEHLGKLARCPACKQIFTVTVDETNFSEPLTPSNENAPELTPLTSASNPYAETQYVPVSPFGASPIKTEVDPSTRLKSYVVQAPNGTVYGPTDYASLENWVNEGRVNAQFVIREVSASSWQPIGNVLPQLSINPFSANYSQPMPGYPGGTAAYPGKTHDRSVTVLVFGILSLLCFGPIFGPIAMFIGYQDLWGRYAAQLNPSVRTTTQVGFWLGVVGTIWGVLGAMFMLLGIIISAAQAQ